MGVDVTFYWLELILATEIVDGGFMTLRALQANSSFCLLVEIH
jgi:hypothetical protein